MVGFLPAASLSKQYGEMWPVSDSQLIYVSGLRLVFSSQTSFIIVQPKSVHLYRKNDVINYGKRTCV